MVGIRVHVILNMNTNSAHTPEAAVFGRERPPSGITIKFRLGLRADMPSILNDWRLPNPTFYLHRRIILTWF